MVMERNKTNDLPEMLLPGGPDGTERAPGLLPALPLICW